MEEYSENLQQAFKQWHYNAMNGLVRGYGFIVSSHHTEFRYLNYNQALDKIKQKSPKLFKRLERMAKSYK